MNMIGRKEDFVSKLFEWRKIEMKKGLKIPSNVEREMIRRILSFNELQRSLRVTVFDSNVLNDQAWLILQAIFAHSLQADRPMRTKDVWQLTSLPETTILRYLQHLENFGLIKREPDEADARVTLIKMTLQGSDWMFEYFSQLIHLDRQQNEDGTFSDNEQKLRSHGN